MMALFFIGMNIHVYIKSKKTGEIYDKIITIQPKSEGSLGRVISNPVYKFSKKYDLDYNLVLAVIYHESSFRPMVEGKGREIGLMQISYHVWKDELNLPKYYECFDIYKNIDYGCQILKIYIDKTGNFYDALYLYNGKSEQYANRVYSTYTKLLNNSI